MSGTIVGPPALIRPAPGSLVTGSVSIINDVQVVQLIDGVQLLGTRGDDLLSGGTGNDRFFGDGGNDVINGGPGTDTAYYTGPLREHQGQHTVTKALDSPRFPLAAGSDGTDTFVVTDKVAGRDGTDKLTDVEVFDFLDGRLVFGAADPAAQVARLYEAALDRLPDQAGLNFWIDAVQHGQPLSGLAQSFIASAEFQARFGGATSSNGAFVDQLYQNVLGRAGEAVGRKFWVDSLEHGTSRAEVLAAFSESPENNAATAALVQKGIWDRSETAAVIARMYDTVFGRLPDVQGLAAWKAELEGGQATPAQVAGAFTSSAEFRAKYGALDNRGFADALYRNTLDRAPDQAGLDHWTNVLNSSVSRAEVVLAFSESQEHVNLTAHRIQNENSGEFGILFA